MPDNLPPLPPINPDTPPPPIPPSSNPPPPVVQAPFAPAPEAQPMQSTPPAPMPPITPNPGYVVPPPPPAPVAYSKPKSRIIFPILILLVIVGLIFFGVNFLIRSKGGSSNEPVTLTYWGLWEPEEVMSEIITDFKKSNPKIDVVYKRQSPQDYRERLQNTVLSGSGPDIFRFHNTWPAMFKNILSPLPTDIMDKATFDQTFFPVAQRDLLSGSQYLGFPLMTDTLLLYYNEDLLASSGKTPPQTWDELLETSKDLKQGGVLGVAMGNATNVDHWQEILGLLLLQNNTNMNKVASTVGSDGKNLGADALRYYTLFQKDYQIWDETLPRSTQAFAEGRLAFYFGPSWEAFEFLKNTDLHFSTIRTPKLLDVEKYYASYWVDGVSSKSTHQKEAWQFLKFLTQKENMQKLYNAQSQTRLFGEPPSRQDLVAEFNSTESQNKSIVNNVMQSAPKSESWYLASSTYDGDSGINSRISTYFKDAVNAVNSGTDPAAALLPVEQGIAQVLSQYNSQ